MKNKLTFTIVAMAVLALLVSIPVASLQNNVFNPVGLNKLTPVSIPTISTVFQKPTIIPGINQKPASNQIVVKNRLIITENDTGKSYLLVNNQEVFLRLSRNFLWQGDPVWQGWPKITSSDIADLFLVDRDKDPGFTEWEVRFRKSGAVTISATGIANTSTQEKQKIEFKVNISLQSAVLLPEAETKNQQYINSCPNPNEVPIYEGRVFSGCVLLNR